MLPPADHGWTLWTNPEHRTSTQTATRSGGGDHVTLGPCPFSTSACCPGPGSAGPLPSQSTPSGCQQAPGPFPVPTALHTSHFSSTGHVVLWPSVHTLPSARPARSADASLHVSEPQSPHLGTWLITAPPPRNVSEKNRKMETKTQCPELPGNGMDCVVSPRFVRWSPGPPNVGTCPSWRCSLYRGFNLHGG